MGAAVTPITVEQALNAIRVAIIGATTLSDQQVWIGRVGALGFGGPAITVGTVSNVPVGRVERGGQLRERRRIAVQLTGAGDAGIAQLRIAARVLAGGDVLANLSYHGEGARRNAEITDAGNLLRIESVTQQWEYIEASPADAYSEIDAIGLGMEYAVPGDAFDPMGGETFDLEEDP